MAVTTKKQFAATTNATTTVFSPVSIQLNNQDDLDVYVTLSGGTRVLQLRQSTGSTAQSSHPQVNNTDGLYFPAVSAGTTLYNYTLSSDNNTITFNSALPSGAVVFCERRTRDADSSYTSFASGSTIRATDLNNSSTESNFTGQDARNKALDLEGSIFGGIQPSINGVAQPFVNSSKIIDGSIATADIADSAITSAKLADGTIVTGDIADGLVTTAKIAADAVNGTKIADDSINSEHYVDGSIDTVHIADSQVTTAKLNDNAVTTAKITADAVTGAKIADDQINSEHYVDGSIDTAHIADAQITTAKIVDANVTTAKIAADAINGTKIADDSINSEHYVDGSIDTAHIADSQVTTAKIADANVTAAKIASNAVTTDKIQDGELTTLAGMQSTTASNLASATALTASTAELNQLDGITLETSVTTSSDTRIPTSKAVNDLVLSVTNALGGFVAIANETSFPTANPDPSNGAGTVVSISQLASGLAVNGSGVATISNGAGSGNTVTINGFPTSLVSQTLPATSGLQVQTTSTLHTYTFHKQLASAADIQAISATVNSFSNRYRVSASAPTSSLDGGDLWYDTTNSKLMVYSSQNSAWEESSAIGNFFICTLSSSSSTGGGSATANGTAYRFTISNAPQSAQSLIVSVDGVVQKPNAGSSQPSEGFVLVGNDIIFGSAPVNGASIFVTAIGSTVGIGTPSDNTVTTAILQNGSVTTAKIVDANVTTAKITDANVTTAKIAADAVDGTKIADDSINSEHYVNGSIDTAHIANQQITSDKLADNSVITAKIQNGNVTEAKLGSGSVTVNKIGSGAVATAAIADDAVTNAKISIGAVGTTEISNNAVTTAKIADDAVTAAKLANTSVTAASYGSSTSIPSITVDAQGRITAASGNTVNTDLVGDTSPQLGGNLDTNSFEINLDDNHSVNFGDSTDLNIKHTGSYGVLQNTTGGFFLQGENAVTIKANNNVEILKATGDENMAKFIPDGAVELYHNNSKKLETTNLGCLITGELSVTSHLKLGDNDVIAIGDGEDLKIYHSGSHSFIEDAGTGSLKVRGSVVDISATNADNMILATEGGTVNLYHNGSKKFETTSSGIATTGRSTASQPRAMYYGLNNPSGYNGWKSIQWRVQEDRTSINHSNSISRFTPQVAGWYLCQFNHYHSNGVHSSYYLEIKKNGNASWAYQKFPDNFSANISAVIDFNGSSDYVEFRTHHGNTAHNCEDGILTNMRMVYLTNY